MEHNNRNRLLGNISEITQNLEGRHLADVFRFVSFIPKERFNSHSHRRIEMNYVKKGSCIIRLDNESVPFREGELMIISSEVEHAFQAGPEGCTLMQLEFLPEMFAHFQPAGQALADGQSAVTIFSEENRLIKIVNNVRIMRAIQRIVNEMNQKSNYYQHLVVMYYAELLILIYRHLDEAYLPICTNESLRRAISYIRMNYQSDIAIRDVAAETGIGERYLRKLFAQHLNLSPLDYLNQIRINKSIELLRNTEMSVKEICFMCGFQSPQYFSRIFKQQMGISPREVTK